MRVSDLNEGLVTGSIITAVFTAITAAIRIVMIARRHNRAGTLNLKLASTQSGLERWAAHFKSGKATEDEARAFAARYPSVMAAAKS